jgi:hypothetical protein
MNTPTPTPTPRTDDAQWGTGKVTTDFARALERELTALTAERDQLRADCENETKWAAHYLAESIAVKGERDHLRAEVERYRLVTLKLDAELAAERARLDWVFRNCKVTADDYTTGNRDVYAIHDREDLGAAMKEDAQ